MTTCPTPNTVSSSSWTFLATRGFCSMNSSAQLSVVEVVSDPATKRSISTFIMFISPSAPEKVESPADGEDLF